MKTLLLVFMLAFMLSCNDSATGPDHSLDNTDNDDTPARVIDSLGEIDTLKGR